MTETTASRPRTVAEGDYKIADIDLAGQGRKQIELAEHEMPGLMALRAEYFDEQPEAEAFRLRRAALYAQLSGDPGESRRLLRRSIRRRPTLGAARDYLRVGLR